MSEPVVLLVDDEVFILSALRRSLRREGWDVLTANGAKEALATVQARSVDLVVSDQKMPDMNGLELLAAVGERSPGTRRVLLTGWPEMLTRAQLEASGIDAVLPKPWEDQELKTVLRGLV